MDLHQLVIDFTPIAIVYIFLAYTRDAILFSDTILGKCVAISIITLYTYVNPMYGLFACMCVLLYYQTDFVNDVLNMERSDEIENRLIEMNRELLRSWGESSWAKVDAETTIAKNVATLPKPRISPSLEKMVEGFSPNSAERFTYTNVGVSREAYIERVPDQPDKKAELMAFFRKENCVNRVLQYRNADVRPEMAEHVFRELKWENEFHKCNPCDSNCSFSIVEEKLMTESKLKTPVSSNDFFQTNIEYMKTAFGNTATQIREYLSGDHFAIFS